MTKPKNPKNAEKIADQDLDGVHGGAWSLGAYDGSTRGFNPQPEPPAKAAGFSPASDLEARGFNPQPEPPAKSKLLRK